MPEISAATEPDDETDATEGLLLVQAPPDPVVESDKVAPTQPPDGPEMAPADGIALTVKYLAATEVPQLFVAV